MGDVIIIEAITEDHKLFIVFCVKDTYYLMKIMASWMTIDALEGAKTRRDFIYRSGMKDTN